MRSCGILMPVFSLPGDYGCGTLGKSAENFIDFLKNAGQTYWQILPLNPTQVGNSPYSSYSLFAGNPYFIDPDTLVSDGLLSEDDIIQYRYKGERNKVDYTFLAATRDKMLRTAFSNFDTDNKEFKSFCKENDYWLCDFALYVSVKTAYGYGDRALFDKPLYLRIPEALKKAQEELKDEINYNKFVQFEFFKQWLDIRDYANKNGIKIIGDMPMYVGCDSADVWANPMQFDLDRCYNPKTVSGVPPDAFSSDGQLWGTPVYNWDYMKKDGFSWWKNRLKHNIKMYDTVRIDHFRAFSAYYAVKSGSENAKNGKWKKAYGKELFCELKREFKDKLSVIAEDLGTIDNDVKNLIKCTGFPNMNVLQFAFSSEEESTYLPHNHKENSVTYTGTHDNDTIIGWYKTLSEKDRSFAESYLNFTKSEGFNFALIRAAYMSVSEIAIVPMQDFLGLDGTARINIPGVPCGNWEWRIDGVCLNDWLAKIIYDLSALYFRTNKKE
ncbi:MAG: 4-alpha-glucanotransferase [Clostridia bacterium]|nr:4-alpha-glucanotransferase [Clostridia bacterium]